MQLFEHQKTMAVFHLARPLSIDLSEVGVGKTAGVITWLKTLISKGEIKKTLIICPNSILENWVTELGLWAPELSFKILRGDRQDRVELLLSEPKAQVYLINYEGTRVLKDWLVKEDVDALVCDEIHHVKNPSAKQTKAVMAIAYGTKFRKGMTGTPLLNHLEDLWSIYQVIDPSVFAQNRWGFRQTYMQNANAGKPWMKFPDWQPRSGAVEKIKKRIAPASIYFAKKDVLKFLPPMLFQKRLVELGGEQRRVYEELRKDFLAELDHGEILAVPDILPRLVKLLQVTGGFA